MCRKFKFLGIFVLVFFSLVDIALSNSACPVTPLNIDDFEPEKLSLWIEENGSNLNSAKDFLCCVPDQVKNRFAIAHSSLAAQNGNAKNPRVIFFHKSVKDSINPNDNRLHFAFSLNSGRSHLNNPNNIEFVFADKLSGKLSYFDLEISSNHRGFVGGENPEKCMACHGTYNSFGAKPIFTDRPWHNFVSGNTFAVNKHQRSLRCEPVPKEVVRKLDIDTLDSLLEDALNDNSNFACMNIGTLTGARSSISNSDEVRDQNLLTNLIEFDDALRHAHRHRIWKDISSSPQYDQFKYLMLGATLCKEMKLRNWVPNQVLYPALAEVDFYDHRFGQINSRSRFQLPLGGVLQASHQKLSLELQKFDQRTAELSNLLNDSRAWQNFLENSDSELHFGRNPLACYRDQAEGLIQRTFSRYNATRPLLSRFELDNLLARESSNLGNHPILRFIYEGLLARPAIDLNMSLYAGVSSNSLSLEGFPILSQESPESILLNELFSEHEIRYGGLSNDFAMTVSKLRREGTHFLIEAPTWNSNQSSDHRQRVFSAKIENSQICHQLKSLSFSALEDFIFEK